MTIPQELPNTTEIICQPSILDKEVPIELRRGLVSNAKEYGFVGVMPLCDDGAVIKFKTQRLRGYREYTLTRFLGFLPDPFADDSYLETVVRHEMVGFGHNGNKDEVVFIM